MAGPYDGLWGDVSGGATSTAPNPYSGLWDSLSEEEKRRRKRAELAATWGAAARGQNEGLGRVPVPDTSLSGVVATGVDLAAATAGNAMVGSANLPRLALAGTEEMIHRAGTPFREASQTQQDREAADRLATAQRLLALGGRPRSPLAGRLLAATASPQSSVPDPLGPVQEMTQQGQDAATQRFAEASTDLPVPLAAAGFWGATTAGMAADASQYLAPGLEGGSRPLSEAAQEALVRRGAVSGAPTEALGREALRAELLAKPITRPEIAAAVEAGVPAASGRLDFGAWLARAGLGPEDVTPRLERQFLDLHEPDPVMTRPTAPSPELAARFPGATIDARDVFEGDVGIGGIQPRREMPPISPTGSPPDRGLVVARIGRDGRVYYGQPGDLHFHLTERFPDQAPWKNIGGFAGPDGQFLSREQALAASDVPARANDLGLDAMDYNAAVRRATGDSSYGFTPRNSEAGFVRNPWAPRSDLYRQTYQIRHDFVTEQNAAVRDSAVRSSALQAAIPSKAAREDMTAVFHGTGNPLVKGDTPQAAAARLAASPYAADAQAAIDAWRQRSDELFKMAKDAGAEDLGYFKDYLHMVYEPPAGEAKGAGLRIGESATTSVERERLFATPEEAMRQGYTPRSLDFSVLMHETERAHAHTRAILGLMDAIGEVNDLAQARALRFGPVTPEALPETLIIRAWRNPNRAIYEPIPAGKYPILERAAPGRVDPEAVQMARKLQAEAGQANAAVAAQRFQPTLPGLEDLGPRPVEAPGIPETPPNIYVHRDLWRNLQPIMDHAETTGFDKALSVVKRVNFLGSLFHGASLTEAAMDTLGPARGLYEGARRGFGIPGVSQIAARLGGGKVAEDAVQEAIRAGVNVEPPKLDMMKGTFEGLLNQWESSLQKGGGSPLAPRNALAKTLSAFRGTAAMYDTALWKNYHAPLKVTAYHILLDRVRNNPSAAVARALESGALTQDELAQSVARHVNSAFGGQNWELLQNDLLSNPKALRWARRVMLSPDWNYSAIDTGLSPLSADPVRRQLGRTYYKNAAKLLIGWNMLNYGLSGHAMWDNEPGHKWDLETGLHDEKGRKLFYQVSKHAMETPDFFLGRDRASEHLLPIVGSIPHFMLRKANSPLVGAYTFMSGRSPTGFPGALERAQDEADRQARPLSGFEDSAARLRDLTSGVLPFVAQDPESMGRKMLIPFVEKKGMSLHDGRILFAEALRRNDQQGVEKIRQWLVDNGYDGEAINRALSGAYSGIRAEQKANRPAAPPPGPPQPANPYEGLWR